MTRQSIVLAKMMDPRVKPAGDAWGKYQLLELNICSAVLAYGTAARDSPGARPRPRV